MQFNIQIKYNKKINERYFSIYIIYFRRPRGFGRFSAANTSTTKTKEKITTKKENKAIHFTGYTQLTSKIFDKFVSNLP